MNPPGRRILTFPVVGSILLAVQSVVLLQFPLLNVLGLEFSVASAPLVSLISCIVILRRTSDAGEETDPYKRLVRFLHRYWYVLMLPGAIALAHALFVTNCNIPEAIAYYLLIVPFAGAYGGGLAVFSQALLPRSARTLSVLLWCLSLLHVLIVTFTGPQIFAFNPILGYFPGLSYDSTRSVLPELALYRLTTVLFITALLGTARYLSRETYLTFAALWRNGKQFLLPWAVLVVCWFASDRIGFSSSLSRIERELGGSLRTAHFVIVYPKDRIDEEGAARLGEYQEFLYHRLSRTMRVSTSRAIVAVYYASEEQKSRLVGGGGTNFTKPWLWQMHLMFADRDRVLKHELVHVLAAEFGFPVVRVGLNSGFIEGLAVAMERESYGMTLDHAAASIFRVRETSDISSVFSLSGFFRSHASVSYTLAGSFCRYLIVRYGMRRFKRAYRSGSFSTYGRSFTSLADEWKERIRHVQLSDGEVLKARYLFDRPPAFFEECFQFKGNTLAQASDAYRAGRDSAAAAIAAMVDERSPSATAAYTRARSLVRMGKISEAMRIVQRQFDKGIDTAFLPLSFVYADALWMSDSVQAASGRYDLIRRADISDGWTEASEFRLAMLKNFPHDTAIREAVILASGDSSRRAFLREWVAGSTDPLKWYALSRYLSVDDQGGELSDALMNARDVGSPFLRYTVKRRLASLYREKKEYERGKMFLWEAQNDAEDEVRLQELREGLDWLNWLEARVPPGS